MIKYTFGIILLCLTCLSLNGQDLLKIQGTVNDYLHSQPVVKASLAVKGDATISTETKEDGTFEIQVPSMYSVLVISFPGFQTREFPLLGRNNVAIDLYSADMEVNEAVVKLPYYTTNQKNLNGAYSVISKSYNKAVQQRDLTQLLGAVPGLRMENYSSVPGEGSSIQLGGVRSLYAGNEPLIVVDGLPLLDPVFQKSIVAGSIYNYLSDINVKDIEQVTFLRDASAAGIYGSRASNGVIVITTRSGSEKTYFDVSFQSGVSPRFKELPVMNSAEYLSYFQDKISIQGLDPLTVQENFPFLTNSNTSSVEYWRYANNTDWQKVVTRNAMSQDYYVNLRGGDATAKYSLNVGYNNAAGVGRGIDANRFTSRFNLDFNISKKLSAGTNISYINSKRNLQDQGFAERVNPLYLSLVKPPILSPYQRSAEGVTSPFFDQPAYDLMSNPLAVVNGVSNAVGDYWVMGTVYGKYQFNNSWSTRIAFGLDQRALEEKRFTPSNGIFPIDSLVRFDRTIMAQQISDLTMSVEHTATYQKQLNSENNVLVFGGYNIEVSNYNSLSGFTTHSSSDDFQSLGDGQKVLPYGEISQIHNFSAFANADYSFRAKYLLKLGLRLDGSSRFGENVDKGIKLFSAPFAFLPYGSFTWKMKGEKWFRDIAALDEFNLRTSYGLTANQNIPVDARYTLYTSKFYLNRPGLVPYSLGNDKIKWESTSIYYAGLDFSLMKKLIGIRLDYYNSTTKDLLVPMAVDGTNGVSQVWGNSGSMKNQSLELGINTLGHSGDFTWNIGFSLAKSLNEIVSLPKGSIYDGLNGFMSVAQAGSHPSLIMGLKNFGVFQTAAEASASGMRNYLGVPFQAGDPQYEDVNADHIIDYHDYQVIGDPNPKLYGGLNANVTYKSFSLDALFSYSYGNDILNVLRSKLETGQQYQNQSTVVLSRFMDEGDVTSIPRSTYSTISNITPSSAFVEDGSYIKWKALTLTYTFKDNIAFLRSSQVYISGYNLVTFTKYLGWDPEVATGQTVFSRGYDFGNYPGSRTFMLGIRVGL